MKHAEPPPSSPPPLLSQLFFPHVPSTFSHVLHFSSSPCFLLFVFCEQWHNFQVILGEVPSKFLLEEGIVVQLLILWQGKRDGNDDAESFLSLLLENVYWCLLEGVQCHMRLLTWDGSLGSVVLRESVQSFRDGLNPNSRPRLRRRISLIKQVRAQIESTRMYTYQVYQPSLCQPKVQPTAAFARYCYCSENISETSIIPQQTSEWPWWWPIGLLFKRKNFKQE